MVIRILIIAVSFSISLLFTGAVYSQSKVGDWQLEIDGKGTAFERRIAMTPAQPYSGDKPEAILAIRRMKPDSEIELLVTATFDEELVECDYDDWEIAIDKNDISVLDYELSPATVVLELEHSNSDRLWRLIRKGSKLAVRVEQKCGGFFSNDTIILVHTFSLRGSTAAFNFVIGNVD